MRAKHWRFYLQSELNNVMIEGKTRKSHTPGSGRYYILGYTDIPGVIVETAFISNEKEREMLTTEEFLGQLATAIAAGTEQYLEAE